MDFNTALSNDLNIRRKRLQEEMQRQGVDACILTTSVNVFYMVGAIYNGYFYLPSEGEAIHFIKRNIDFELEHTIHIRKPEQILEELQKAGLKCPQKILLEIDTLSFSDCDRLIASLKLQKENIVNASVLLRRLRSVKTDFELSQVRLCAKRHIEVYKQIPYIYKEGMTDLDLQFEIEFLMRKHGSLGIFRSYGANMDIYMGSLLVGENAESPSPFDFALGGKGGNSVLPLGACGEKIKKGNTIMVDMAGNYSPWMTDMTRVFSVGKISDLAYKAHAVSGEIHQTIVSQAKPGIACADLYNIAMDIVNRNGLDAYFMGTRQQAKFIGHGVGLEINEPPVLTPRSKELLETNIVFALEPKFVIPEVGAVGYENTYLVTDNGLENLTVLEENIIDLNNQ
ncbi:M24 family metallopeptidase [Dysgonomonas macrotermitis]|uniref:Xaa-Pro aminopeptidase n=1 Tax=Dysgonomonas macrotermitis TaxID=1346286 RepID=A0A1M5G828_9BACT|nr:Xaa-Pro peptidase family protein [Dysgonomonas macrotermitis]SHF99917.1 Xaa-Pro aminopeptidase [Dysgonomonas macrotermitis]